VGVDHTYQVNWGNCYLQNIATQSNMVQGRSALAFTYQYEGTLPYLYYAEMLLRWGAGPLLGLLALAGLGWAVWRGLRPFFPWLSMFCTKRPSAWRDGLVRVWQRAQQPIPHLPHYLLLSWVVPYLLTTGNFQVKFMRYLLPVTPILLLYGAALLWEGRRTRDEGRKIWVVTIGGDNGCYVVGYGAVCAGVCEYVWAAPSLGRGVALGVCQSAAGHADFERAVG
jgi:hypothetical protein